MILWLLFRRRWAAAIWAIGTIVASVAVTLPIVGLGPWLDYPTVLANLGAPVDTTDTIAPTVWLSGLVPTMIARAIVVVVGVAAVAWASQRRTEAVSYAVAVVVSVLMAPAIYQHYLAVLVLPLLLALRWAPPVWWVAIAYLLMFGGEQEALGGIRLGRQSVLPTVGALLLLVDCSGAGRPGGRVCRRPQVPGRLRQMPDRPADLTLVLPAYNEADRIGPALDELFGYLGRRGDRARDGAPGAAELPASIEVLVVDDGSNDGTGPRVEARPEASDSIPGVSLRVIRVPHGGKGAAVRAGMLAATGDLVIFADADMATPPDQIPLLVEALADHDVALGSRIQPDGSDMRATQPGYRRLLGKVFHAFASVWVVGPVQDTQCGFKGFTREAAQDLFGRQRVTSIVFDVEVIYLARRRGYSLAVVPIRWYDKRGSRMRARPGLAVRVAWDLFRIPLIHRGSRRRAAERA